MPLALLEYQVFKKSGPIAQISSFPFNYAEVDMDPVPAGQTWRIENVSLAVITTFPAGSVGLGGPYCAGLYDQMNPGPGAVPIALTDLAPEAFPNFAFPPFSIVPFGMWSDYYEPAQPLTIRGGEQFAILFSPINNVVAYMVRVQYAIFQGTGGVPTPVAGSQTPPQIPVGI